MNEDTLRRAYALGATLANEGFEKRAFLGAVLRGGKFLLGMGHLGNAGGLASRISAHHVGMPLGFGIMNALSAEEGHRAEAFGAGVLGGLAFNGGMSLGGTLGKRLFAPLGQGTKGLARMGFNPSQTSYIEASRRANKALHGIERKMQAGNYSAKDAVGHIEKALLDTGTTLNADLAKQLAQLRANAATVGPEGLAKFQTELSGFTGALRDTALNNASAHARNMYKGTRHAKMIGGIVGGMGLGMTADHLVQNSISPHGGTSIYSPDYGSH